jgi:glycosyltransferase involved in cell wall biosynthesis
MNITLLTPGAAGMYCGGCMRDNALTAALRRLGHDALQVPLYTPLTTDEPDNSIDRVFFGGVNVYLQQKSKLLSNLPAWLDKRLDSPEFLRFATSFGMKTNPADLGEMTVSMLKGEDGRQAHELDKLLEWLKEIHRPDVIALSNALMVGTAHRLRTELKVPVVCTLQGEDYFLDHLPQANREQAWDILRASAAHVDTFIAVSHYYAETMAKRLNLPASKIVAVQNGIDLKGYAPAATRPEKPTIVYLARMAPEKGLKTLVDAFTLLRTKDEHSALRLRIGGSLTANDKEFVHTIQHDLKKARLSEHVDFLPNLSKEDKIALLQSGSVFSVPATYGESFGLFVLESLACGVPVVQPRHASFPEVLAHLNDLLLDPEHAIRLGKEGRENVLTKFSVDRMARDVADVLQFKVQGSKFKVGV